MIFENPPMANEAAQSGWQIGQASPVSLHFLGAAA
jgi:hypothetical protein